MQAGIFGLLDSSEPLEQQADRRQTAVYYPTPLRNCAARLCIFLADNAIASLKILSKMASSASGYFQSQRPLSSQHCLLKQEQK